MRYSVKLLPVAYADLRKAKKWYNDQRTGLGEEFKEEVNKEIEYISNNPLHYQVRYKEFRQSLVYRFSYGIFYLFEKENNRIVIIGVLHTRRNPKIIERRIKKQ